MTRSVAAFVRLTDWFNDWLGRGVAWLTLAMVIVAFSVVVLRYVFSLGWVWMQESYVWLHGIVFMMGAAYTLLHEGHVRVDILYQPGSVRFKASVNLVGSLVLLVPIVVLVFVVSWDYVLESWARLEESREAGGLLGLFVLKTVIWIFCATIALQCLSLAGRSLLILTGRDEFARAPQDHEMA